MVRSATLNVMVAAAQKAGRGLTRDFGEVENLQVSVKGPSDFVTAADLRAEQVLRRELERARPDYGFLLEEGGVVEGSDKRHRWIIDPLDGTTNFMHSVPLFAISVALERDGEIVAALVYNPVLDETFTAERGGGAFFNNRRIRVAARRNLQDAVMTTGIPHLGRGDGGRFIADMRLAIPSLAGIRRTGSAALDLAWTAAGRFDIFYENGLQPWDVAAGVLLVREAGGMATDPDGRGNPLATGNILAANGDLHGAFSRLLADSRKA
ncbi:MAG: inositol monophosphatase [Flavobacteriaceae bacterium]